MAEPKPVDQMTRAEAEHELAALAAEIARNDVLYYRDDSPENSDAE